MNKTKRTKKSPDVIKIAGLILSESYQKCKLFAQKLRQHYSKRFKEHSSKGFLEVDWLEYLNKLQKDIGGQTWAVRHGVVVFINDKFIGGEKELFDKYSVSYLYKLPPPETITELAKQEYCDYLNHTNLLYTYLELSLDDEYMGTLVFQLRPDLLPNSSAWFAMLCDTGNHVGFSYRGSNVHRVCRKGWFQAGELGVGPSSGFLEDESFCYKHDRRGVISFANDGKDTNRCQFFVTFKPSPWMDDYYVAFGRLVEGSDVLRRIENTKCTYECPDHSIVIANCGLADVGLGRHLVTKLKIKGITVGEPHIHLETFVDLLLDSFCEVIFERLNEEEKRKVKQEWMYEMLWESITPHMAVREPVPDVEDSNDRSSSIFSASRFLTGLYDLRHIPDHWISSLVRDIAANAVEQSHTQQMATSIVDFILENVRSSSETCVASAVRSISGMFLGASRKPYSAMIVKSISKIADDTCSIGMLSVLSDTSLSESGTQVFVKRGSSQRSTVIGYIIDSLMKYAMHDIRNG